jgi:hypothetical protein
MSFKERFEELEAEVARVQRDLLRMDGLSSVGIGTSRRYRRWAEWQPRSQAGPDDLVIKVGFETRRAMRKSEPELQRILGSLPYESMRVGVIRAL